MKELLILSFGSGLIFNALLSYGIGIRSLQNRTDTSLTMPYNGVLTIFISTPILWSVVSYILAPLGLYYLEMLFLFPLSIVFSMGLRYLIQYIRPAYDDRDQNAAFCGYDGLVLLSSYITLRLAHSFIEALFVSLSFSLSYFLIVFLLSQILKRSSVEAIPEKLRGVPIVLISAGLLAMIFGVVLGVFFKISGI